MATTQPVEGPLLPSQSETSTEILTPSSTTSSAPEPELVEAHVEELPTESHQLAHATEGENIDEVGPGLAQLNHGQTEVKDLGWNEDSSEIAQPLVGGLSNEELWTLLRRFNKVCFPATWEWHGRQCVGGGSFANVVVHSKCTMSNR